MEQNKQNKPILEDDTPAWLRSIQLNSWEAELLISALFLYILFQIPEILFIYKKVRFSSGDIFYRMISFFEDAVKVLSIGYVVHIITRGIWVANIGLSYVFPKGIDIKKVGLKGRFRKELENNETMDHSVLLLERIASITYAISFMCSGLVMSVGAVLITFILYTNWILTPAMQSSNVLLYLLSILGLLIYLLILLIVFIDFLTNGFFRRDNWAAKPYYYIVIVFRVLTLSFIYNRMLLVIISSLPKWKAHLVPIAIVAFISAYFFLGNFMDKQETNAYYEDSFDNMRYENYENLRHKDSKIFVTIQSDIIEQNVIKLFVNTLDELVNIHGKNNQRIKDWHKLTPTEKGGKLEDYLNVSIDSTRQQPLNWKRIKNPLNFDYGYITYIDISNIKSGDHMLTVSFDTLSRLDAQKKYLKDIEPSRILQAKIPFFKTN